MNETTKVNQDIELTHPKLVRSLYMTMLIYGTTGPFRLNASREKRINNLKLRFNKGIFSYTSDNSIVIGLNHPYFKNDINHDYHVVKTLIGHEIGHIRFTNRTDYSKFVYSAGRNYGSLVKPLALDIIHVLEDVRVEHLMGKLSKRLKKQFHYLSILRRREIEDMNIFEKKFKSDEERLNNLAYIIDYITKTKKLPDVKDGVLRILTKRIYKYILFAEHSFATSDVAKVANKIMFFIKPLLKNLNKEVNTIFPGLRYNNIGSSNDYVTNQEISEVNITNLNDIFTNEEIEEIKNELEKEELINNRQEITKENDFKYLDEKNLDEENINLEEKIEKNNKKEEIDISFEELEKEMFEPITQSLVVDYFQDKTQDIRERRDSNLENEKRKKIKPQLENEHLHENCIPIFIEKNNLKFFKQQEYDNIIMEFKKIINDGVKSIKAIKERHELKTLSLQKRGTLSRRRLINAAAFNDKNIFDKKQSEIKELEMDVMILVDSSGSNNASVPNRLNNTLIPRFRLNQMAVTVAHEIMKKSKIKHTVWSFDEMYEKGPNKEIYQRFIPIIDFSNSLKKYSGLAIASIQAFDFNRDGYSLAYAADFFKTISKSDKKLLIVISDGAPNGKDYQGQVAVWDTAETIRRINSDGIKVVGIFTGSENENPYFKQMYPNHIFFNNESAYELPETLKKILLKEYKNMLE